MWSTLVGTDEARDRTLLEPSTTESQNPRLLMPVPRGHFEVGVDDALGEVSVLAQVDQMLAEGDEDCPGYGCCEERQQRPLSDPTSRTPSPRLQSRSRKIVPVEESDFFIPGLALILRAICAYR